MAFYDEKTALTRERRSTTLSHYHGTLTSLIADTSGEEIPSRNRTLTQARYDDILYALGALRGIKEAAIVVYGPIGCSAAAIGLAESGRARWYSVNIGERDSILGSEALLRETILRAVDEGATVVFVVGSPVVAINNDNVHAVLLELEDEIDIPAVFVSTDGFKSRSPLTGLDHVFHELLGLVDDIAPEEDFINLLAVGENVRNIAAISAALTELGIRWNLLPRFSSLGNIRVAGGARATVSLNTDESEYFGMGLEGKFGVPYLRAPAPVGLAAIRRFFRDIGQIFGIEARVEAYIEVQEEALQSVLAGKPLDGKKVFLQVETALAESFVGLVRDLGGEVSGLALTNIDLSNRAQLPQIQAQIQGKGDIPVLVAVGQPFEVANVLARTKPDYYVGPEQVSFAAHYGALPVSLRNTLFYGYEGISRFAAKIGYPVPDIRDQIRTVYNDGWLKKSGNWHVKREVR